MTTRFSLPSSLQWIGQQWRALPTRRRHAAGVALMVGAVALLWTAVLQPAWQRWQVSDLRLGQLTAELVLLQTQAHALSELRRQPDHGSATWDTPTFERALHRLNGQWLGDGVRLTAAEQGWDVVFEGAHGVPLAHWLIAVREQLAATVVYVDWERRADGTWSGRCRVQRLGDGL